MVGFAVSGHAASAEDRALYLYNAHTKERATIVFKRNGSYDPAGLAELNRFLRDWRRNQPIKMDPHLFDLVWEVYQQTGSSRPITVICGYRAPETNAMLRRRSKGVAQNSQHTKGKALDFYIPGVDLAQLRAIGLRMQAGGVGFYPSSGSPFVHMDTGSVRHWPRMSRSQLVKVFPNGHTLHVPSDGKPLPGYAEALAAYKARQARGIVTAPTDGAAPIAVAVADEVPTPRVAPERALQDATLVAFGATDPAADAASILAYPPADEAAGPLSFGERFAATARPAEPVDPVAQMIAFETAHGTPATRAPDDLIAALLERQQLERPASQSASLPIEPTAVVSTVNVGVNLSRPLRADAITTAVLRDSNDRIDVPVPPVLAYAPSDGTDAADAIVTSGVVPHTSPMRLAGAAASPVGESGGAEKRTVTVVYGEVMHADLTLTKLDTQGLRLWIATPSTREKRYALLTMPDFGRSPQLLDKPGATFAAHFEPQVDAATLRTDRFASESLPTPQVVDLASTAELQ
ncbi:DUF882 domain-containing protein [Bauldia sp.]|uniref:DUF882 domain-containing protein n=1 Tax=Bauldia sp. TaxID=2575872 RepID=UPI0025C06500|nr:DUF882 domain-containing protein [Bauldia sp.]